MNTNVTHYIKLPPAVGMGATYSVGSDRYAVTIIEVSKSGKQIVVQDDIMKRIDTNGMSEMQEYEYTPNPQGSTRKFYLNKSGRWQESKGSARLTVGFRRAYYNFSY